MSWFERLTGFPESGYAETKARLEVDGTRLRSRVNGRDYEIGTLELPSLQDLRKRANLSAVPGRISVQNLRGNVRHLHRSETFAGAVFQVASQFNLLEMVSPEVTPEHGVTRYEGDPTQGPACAIAAGAATIYRNYFAPVGTSLGQTRERQLDGLTDLGDHLAQILGMPITDLWAMRNGYALCTQKGLAAIACHLDAASADEVDALRGMLRIGLQRDVEVTDGAASAGLTVTQAFCSDLPVAYGAGSRASWELFARLILDAAYEATLLAGVINAARGASNKVLLTRLGGGAFGNDDRWVDAALHRALRKFATTGLEVYLVSFSDPAPSMIRLAQEFDGKESDEWCGLNNDVPNNG